MQSLERNGFKAEHVKAALHMVEGHRRISFRYELLDYQNRYKKDLTTLLGGRVGNNALAQIKRTATFTLTEDADIDYLKDRIKPYARVWIPPGRILAKHYAYLQMQFPSLYKTIQEAPEEGGWAEFPLGVFVLSTPPRKSDGKVVIREIQAYDQLQVLVDDKVIDRHTVTKNTYYIDAVKNLLDSAGIRQQNLTRSPSILPNDRDWAPGTPKLEIINDLLGAINYRSLFFDENGFAVALPYVSPADRASEYTYRDDDQSVIFPEVEQHLDLFNVANRWVLVVSEPDRDPLVATYTNDNLDSPTSTVNRGRVIVDHREYETAVDQATLNAMAERLAFEASQVFEQVSFSTAIMPHHSDSDVFTLEYTNLGIREKYSEVAWDFELKAGARMNHRIRRVVNI